MPSRPFAEVAIRPVSSASSCFKAGYPLARSSSDISTKLQGGGLSFDREGLARESVADETTQARWPLAGNQTGQPKSRVAQREAIIVPN